MELSIAVRCMNTKSFMLPLLLLMSKFILISSYFVSFNQSVEIMMDFNPSPTISTADTANYSCSLIYSNVSVDFEWFHDVFGVPNSVLPLPICSTNINSGQVCSQHDLQRNESSLSIPGHLVEFNKSQIFCVATNRDLGLLLAGIATLLIQGRLSAVGDLTMQPDGPCCTNITWSPPYTLAGIPILGYNINISRDEQTIYTTSTADTEWIYCPMESGEYVISVGAVNKAGEGNITTVEILTDPQQYNITETQLLSQTVNEFHQWTLSADLSINTLTNTVSKLMDDVQHVTMTFLNTELNITSIGINFNSIDSLTATFVTNEAQLNDKHYTFTLDIVLVDCDLIVRSTIQHSINFFDVINITVVSDITPHPLFTCHFISGSVALGCHIKLLHHQNGTVYEVNITRSSNNGMTATRGFTDRSIPSGSYALSVYDINSDSMISSDPAFSGIDIYIMGRLSAVGDLTMQPDGPCCTNITWSPPYTLAGIPILGYNINISRNEQTIYTTSTADTEWIYCPMEFGEHVISVGAVNKAGEGNITTVEILTDPQQYNITETQLLSQTLNEFHQWTLSADLSINTLTNTVSKLMDDIQYVTMTFLNTELNITSNGINFSSIDSLTATFVTNEAQLNDKHYTFTLDIVLVDCDLIVRSTIQHSINFFDVINITVVSDITPHPLFTCHFISGSVALGCHIKLLHHKNGTVYDVNITRSSNNDMTATGGFTDRSIPSGSYVLSVYDINSDSMISSDPAFSIDIDIIYDTPNMALTIGLVVGISVLIILLIIIVLIVLAVVGVRFYRKRTDFDLPTQLSMQNRTSLELSTNNYKKSVIRQMSEESSPLESLPTTERLPLKMEDQ